MMKLLTKILNSILFLAFYAVLCTHAESQHSNIKFQDVTIKSDLRLASEKIPFFMASELQVKSIENIVSNITNQKCSKDLNSTLWGIVQGLPWAVAMYDSSVKVPVGVESGSVYQFGNFDECVDLNNQIGNGPANDDQNAADPTSGITSKYCLADVTVDGLKVQALASRKSQSNSTVVHWAVCVPTSCNSKDIAEFMSALLKMPVKVDDDKCYTKTEFYATRGMIVYSCIIICFVTLTLFSTIYHAYILVKSSSGKERPPGCFDMIMKSFSVLENVKKLLQKSNDHLGLDAINGIKAISMIAIIAGHALVFIVGGPVLNSDFYAKDIKLVQNMVFINSPLFVDTFLLLSGFLFCRILLRELERRHGKINFLLLYIFRYIRLTPAYLVMITFYVIWLPKAGSGPLWNSRILLEQKRCQESWWINLLYINNYVGTDNLCMFQSWYLAVDTQLFILAPIVIHLLWKCRKAGVWVLTGLTVVTVISPFVLTYFYYFDPTFMPYADEIDDISANTYFLSAYMKTHMRTTAYVFGLLTGFLLHYIEEKNIRFPKYLTASLWTTSIFVGASSMLSLAIFFSVPYTRTESSLYAGLHRFGWSFSIGWLILAVTTGNGGYLKKFLSSRIFAPISRLTYCAYLTNGLVELYMRGTLRTPTYLNHFNLLSQSLSHIGLTFLGALVLCLLFESPIHGIEKIFLRIDRQRQQRDQRKESRSPSTSEEIA